MRLDGYTGAAGIWSYFLLGQLNVVAKKHSQVGEMYTGDYRYQLACGEDGEETKL